MKRIVLLFALSGITWASIAQEIKLPAPSPSATIKQEFATSNIEINYSRPSMRGRAIFGEMIPYGKVWRTGANSATKVTFGEDVTLAGKYFVKAGTYALYTIPDAQSWKIIINKGVGNWGVSGFDAKDDIAEFIVPTQKLAQAVQTFTINIDNITGSNCDIVLSWEKTSVSIPLSVDNDKRITDYLEKAITEPKRPYQQAANYYLETGKHLDKALGYADKAIAENGTAFWLYWLKARIYQKMGNKKEAVIAAEKAATLAEPTAYAEEYKRNAETLKAQMK
jgi:tetratricopeptide (TPR) repeat protein